METRITTTERREIWSRLTSVTQELLILLYGSPDSFLEPELISPLEKYILTFDQFLDDEGLLRQLAFRIGAEVPLTQDADLFLYSVLERTINTFGLAGQAKSNDPTLEQIINMTQVEYERWRQDKSPDFIYYEGSSASPYEGGLRTTQTYHQRLLLYLERA